MKKLDKLIAGHRDEFDDMEPATGHFDRFMSKLEDLNETERPVVKQFSMLKIAAFILILISVSVAAIEFITRASLKNLFPTDEYAALTAEMNDAILYYDNRADKMMTQLQTLTGASPEAREMQLSVQKELQNLDASTAELKRSMKQNPDNERIRAAIIQNQQMKESIISTVLTDLSTSNN